jgi:putative lipoic acid-binding regulatory protein
MSRDDVAALPEQYPCEVPVKAMGVASADFAALVLDIVRRHVADLPESAVTRRPSANGKYVSVTVTVTAQSRAHLENIYRDLKASGRVMVVL